MVHRWNTITVIILASFIFGATQCSQRTQDSESSDAKSPPVQVLTDQTSQKDGTPEANFTEYCSSCHGQKMEMFVDRRWKYGKTKEDISRSIAEGIEEGGMPAYAETFTKQELEDLAEYILEGIKDRESYDSESETTPSSYKTDKLDLVVEKLVDNQEIPWGIKVDREGKIYFTEKKGTLKVRQTNGEIIEVRGLPEVNDGGQGGMLDIALHPEFESNRLIYLCYSKPLGGGKANTAIVRGTLDGNEFLNQEEIFVAQPGVNTKHHFGSRMIFDQEGYLFVTVGDRGRRDEHPQYLTNSCGKVHRIKDNGDIPSDNPFYDEAGAIQSIWSYGHRNQQGMIYLDNEDKIWAHEHGPRGGDELNLIRKGVNYGWPIVSYGINYNGTTFTDKTEMEGFAQPATYWIPSIAPSGMAYVNSDNYPAWKGDILTGSLRFNYISRISIANDKVVEEERVLKDIGRVRSIEMGRDGYLYVGVENPGRIYKVTIAK